MLSLAIHHNLWLTREQRYAIHAGIELVIIGMSVPVWVENDRSTSEPAKEIFCKYYLKNNKIDCPIQIKEDGYEITLPNRDGTLPKLTDSEWRILNMQNQSKLEGHYQKCSRQSSSLNLLDLKDGGSKSLSFREHNKSKRAEGFINFIHFVSMMDIDDLTSSLI